MKFNTEAEAYSFYKGWSVDAMEKRAEAIKSEIADNADADLAAFNIELSGIATAKKEAEANATTDEQRGAAMPFDLNGASLETRKADYDPAGTEEYRSAFYKTLLGRKLNRAEQAAYDAVNGEKRADQFNAQADSAAVIPTQTLNEVVSKARKEGGIMAACRAFNMPSNIAIPVGTPSSNAAWHKEGAAVTTEKVEPVSVTFSANEIIKIFSISAAVQTMSIPAFEAYLTDELSACVMGCIADALINGTGSSQGTGLKTISFSAPLTKVEFTDAVAYADVTATVALLKRGYANGARWAMNNATLYKQFYGLVDANKRPIFIADPKSEEIGKILGFPVIVDDYMADDEVIFGNFNYMGYNLPNGIAIESCRYSSFKNGLIDYRALAVADCKPIVDEAFVMLGKGAE